MSKGSTVVCCEINILMKSLLKYADSLFILHEAAALNLEHLSLRNQELTEDRALSLAIVAHSITLLDIVL